ncbi:MAG TPA: septal ring lytic transglycosylase RlpA family protein [Solirubrobacteraceae bacterium]|nr:septal ring lytic transglycosylase RlpA family protein [Solirubrobacteraceae bacterium]
MRPKLKTRTSRRIYAATFALMLAIPATAVALTVAHNDTQSAIQAKLNRHHVSYGQPVTISGTAAPARPGQRLTLEYAAAGATHWRPLAWTRVRRNGHFRVAARLRRTGLVKVQGPAIAPSAPGALPTATAAASTAQTVTVAAKFHVAEQSVSQVDGHWSPVRGKLLPAVSGRFVRLEGLSHGRWRLLSRARTGAHGGFGLQAKGASPGQQLRVRFRGDRLNTPSRKAAGQTIVFHESIASWYNDAGNTACGFHAFYGVANTSLPCGTKVVFRNGGREVTATVDDRGPFVGGRTWDLNQNTAAALGFGGVGPVLSSR